MTGKCLSGRVSPDRGRGGRDAVSFEDEQQRPGVGIAQDLDSAIPSCLITWSGHTLRGLQV